MPHRRGRYSYLSLSIYNYINSTCPPSYLSRITFIRFFFGLSLPFTFISPIILRSLSHHYFSSRHIPTKLSRSFSFIVLAMSVTSKRILLYSFQILSNLVTLHRVHLSILISAIFIFIFYFLIAHHTRSIWFQKFYKISPSPLGFFFLPHNIPAVATSFGHVY